MKNLLNESLLSHPFAKFCSSPFEQQRKTYLFTLTMLLVVTSTMHVFNYVEEIKKTCGIVIEWRLRVLHFALSLTKHGVFRNSTTVSHAPAMLVFQVLHFTLHDLNLIYVCINLSYLKSVIVIQFFSVIQLCFYLI